MHPPSSTIPLPSTENTYLDHLTYDHLLLVHRQDNVQTQRFQLDDLDAKLRETSERLRRLETKHRRQQSQIMMAQQQRSSVTSQYAADNEGEDDSSGDSDALGRRSPQGDHVPR